jgi:nucleotide-binding universal stress UspA family protein
MKQKSSKKSKEANEKKNPLPAGTISFKRILVPIDFSDHSKKALQNAVTLAEEFDSELILTYVVEPIIYPSDLGFGQVAMPNMEPELIQRGTAGLKQVQKEYVPGKLTSRIMVRTGRPYYEIITTAKEERVDLIVIATHGHTGVEHLIFGSTAEKVVKKAPCAVLIVKPR